jgi:hypothetical protein
MITAQHNGSVFVEILLLNPADKVFYLPGIAAQYVGILLFIFILAQVAYIAIREVGVAGQHSEVEGCRYALQPYHTPLATDSVG